MAFADVYRRQVALLIRVLPYVAAEPCFALKGGTAINLFDRNMPRLSVDIDLTYVPIRGYDESLSDIDAALRRISERIDKGLPGVRIQTGKAKNETLTKFVAGALDAQIKVEVTPVLRGCVYEPKVRRVAPAVEDEFGFAETQIVSRPDLYAGKIVAALDRQHPRDLFDVREMLAGDDVDLQLRRALVVYLLSHKRPMGEILDPPQKDIRQEFERGFAGMTSEPVIIDDLIAARRQLIQDVVREMPDEHRAFLLSFERGEPDWAKLGVETAPKLPAVLWRQQNLEKLDKIARKALIEKLERAFST